LLKSSNPGPLLRVKGLTKSYSQGHWWEKQFHQEALAGVDLRLDEGKTLAVVGKSGSGKSTLALCVAMLIRPDEGQIWFDGCNTVSATKSERAALRPQIQLIFQDSAAALPARFSAAQVIQEPLVIQHRFSANERSQLALELMARVGLSPAWATRLPHQFSGGQRQLLAVARALASEARLLILDEPFVGLDLSVRGRIVNVLMELQAELRLTFMYISHDLELVQHFSDRVAVMDKGRIVEEAGVTEIFHGSMHSETQALLTSADLFSRPGGSLAMH
jgi:ABC-type glutathione transport system ATPase component